MDTGNLIAFIKKFSFGRLIASGILLRIAVAIVDGVFGLEINETPINPTISFASFTKCCK